MVISKKGNEAEIAALREKYAADVAQTPYEAGFMVMTAPDIKEETYYREAMEELKAAKNFDNSLKDLLQKMPTLK